ncbi:hypothetical protein EMCRGX_G019961 [Ephydatia muelleri]
MERSLLLIAVLVYQALCQDLKGNDVKEMCGNDRRPSHEPSETGFHIKSSLASELDGKYTPGQQYYVDLVGLVNPYEGFVIQARDRWNEGLILGSFIPLDTSKAQTIHCLGNDHGTVTHNSKDPVSVQSFIWQAPPTLEGSGEVDFVYSIVQSFSASHQWINLKTTPLNTVQRRYAHADGDMMMNSTDEVHSVMVRVHGVVMTVAFSIFGVIGIFFAAWMKPVLTQNHMWFQIHRAMMTASLLLGVFGFICIFVAHRSEMFNGLYGLAPLDNPKDITHFTFSFIIMALLIANPIIALFRCKPNAPRRWIYNLIHGVIVGLLFEFLILANSCLGLILLGGYGAMFYVYLFFSIFTVVMNIVLGVFTIISGNEDLPAVAKLLCSIWKKQPSVASAHNDQGNEEDVLIGDKKGQEEAKSSITAFRPVPSPSTPAPSLSLIRWGALTLYLLISLPLNLAVIVMITITIPQG